MIWEDERKAPADQLGFVMHLGDFVYEIVWYPEDRPQGYYARRLRDVVRYPHGEKIRDFHVPDHCGRLSHVVSWLSSRSGFAGCARTLAVRLHVGQPRVFLERLAKPAGLQRCASGANAKVAAYQAWFEYQPARVVKAIRN